MGHQFPPQGAAPERRQLLVAAAAHLRSGARLDGGTLDGLRGIRAGRNLRIKPYVSTSGNTVGRLPTGDFDGGVDVKYGVTTGLVWDFTVNTDFSQVEADEQQVNLTRFSLFFPEKRDFFLENVGMFDFGSTAAVVAAAPVGGVRSFTGVVSRGSRRCGCSSPGASGSQTTVR